MKNVALLLCILALIQYGTVRACPTVTVYNATIANICAKEVDNKVYWPDYQNLNQYYRCQGTGNPILETCLPTYVFSFEKQACTLCDKYVPAPPCQSLKGKTCTSFKPPANSLPTKNAKSVPFCGDLAKYKSTFIPTCKGNDVYMSWPNYRNASEFYRCQGVYNPLVLSCNTGKFFNFNAQKCTDCNEYVAAPACEKLHFDKSNKCQRL